MGIEDRHVRLCLCLSPFAHGDLEAWRHGGMEAWMRMCRYRRHIENNATIALPYG